MSTTGLNKRTWQRCVVGLNLKTQENHPSNQINDCWGVNYADWLIRKACWLHAIFSNSLCLRSRHQMLAHLNVSFVLRFP